MYLLTWGYKNAGSKTWLPHLHARPWWTWVRPLRCSTDEWRPLHALESWLLPTAPGRGLPSTSLRQIAKTGDANLHCIHKFHSRLPDERECNRHNSMD